MPRRGARSAQSAEEQENRDAHIHQAKCAERAQGPEESKPWPTGKCDPADRPMVAETAIFVDIRSILSESAESLTHIRRDTQDQRAMAAGLAAWLQMVTHPLVGKVEQVSGSEGHIIGRLYYNMATERDSELRPKVQIDVLGMPMDYRKPLSSTNCAGIVLRAMAADWDYSFSDALKWTLVGNSRLASHYALRTNIGPNSTARQTTKKLYEKLGSSKLMDVLSETLLHDVLTRPNHYKSAMDEWADIERAKMVNVVARGLRRTALRKKKAAQARERKKASGGGDAEGAGGDASGDDDKSADDMEADEDEIDDEAQAELTDDELHKINEEARRRVRGDAGLHINILMSTLHMDGEHNAQRRQCAEAMISSSLHVHNSEILRRFDVTDPVTLSEQLDSLPYTVTSLQSWTSWTGMTFCHDEQVFRDALAAAKRLDATGFMHSDLRKEPVAPERMFTLAGALEQARAAGADPFLCDADMYYGVRGDNMAFGTAYNPERVFDTVTFAPTCRVPTWDREEDEIAALAEGVAQTEANMAPYFGRVPAPEHTRTLSTKDAGFETLRHFRLWFLEDNILEEIEERRKAALTASDASKKMAQSLNHSLALIAGNVGASSDSLFVDSFRRTTDEQIQGILAVDSVGLGMGRTVSNAAENARRECMAQFHKRMEERRRVPGVLLYNVEYTESDIGVNNHYQSNFTIAAERLRPAYEKMEELSRLDYMSYSELMPRFREYCARVFSRIYVTGSFNNGAAMNAIRKFERTMWSDPSRFCGSGAYQRIKPISSALSHFGNRMAGDIIALSAVMDVSFCHQVLWSMLTCTRSIAFHNGVVGAHQINHSQAGDGKSRMVDQLTELSIPQTYVKNMVTSTMAHVDAMAADDQLVIMDEAPKLFQEPNKMSDKDEHTQNNVFRGIMSAGEISVARSVKGQYTNNFTADHNVTFIMNANRMDAPFGYEFSLLTRLTIVRPPDIAHQGSNIYDIHHMRPKSLNTRRPVMKRLWRSTQALQGLMAKMITCYALPDPDTTVVSCLMEFLARRIDAFYPRFGSHMRGSKRVANNVTGYAMFNAQGLVFNSSLSPFAPEHTDMTANPGFDVQQLLRCAPFMFGTTEMMLTSLIQVFEQTVPTELHMMMFALATKKGFARSEFAHLFSFGGRDFSASAIANPAKFTEKGIGGNSDKSATTASKPEFVRMLMFANTVKSMGELELQSRQDRAVSIHPVLDDESGIVYYLNSAGERITPEMREVAEFERLLMEWHAKIPEDRRVAITEGVERSGSEVPRFKRAAWSPEEYGRTRHEMPEFWTVYEDMLDAMEERNNRVTKGVRRVTFVPLEGASSGFNPNYIRFTFENPAEAHTIITQAMGAYGVTKVNWDYVCNHFVRDRNSMMMCLPQLNTVPDSLASGLSWDVDHKNIIRTKMAPIVVYGKGGKYLDISTVWLMLGGWHNHLMSMITALEDDHVPDSGKTLVLPLPSPRAPWLMQSVTLKRRPGHYITVPNPAYVREGSDAAVLSALPAPAADESLFKMIESRALATEMMDTNGNVDKRTIIGDGSAAGGQAFRAASALLNAVGHSVEAESLANATPEEQNTQRRLMRWKETCKRLREEHAHLVKTGKNPAALKLPSVPVDATSDEIDFHSKPDKFMAPTRRELTFSLMPVDDMLHKVFMHRTGQDHKAVKWSEIEEALVSDNRAVHEHLAALHQNAEREAARHVLESTSAISAMTLDDKMDTIPDSAYDSDDDNDYGNNAEENDFIEDASGGGDDAVLDEFRPLDYHEYDTSNADHEPRRGGLAVRRRTKEEQRKFRDDLISVTNVLSKFLEHEGSAVHEYPGKYLPSQMPEWMRRNQEDSALHQQTTPAMSVLTSSLPPPPKITPTIREHYESNWGRSEFILPWKPLESATESSDSNSGNDDDDDDDDADKARIAQHNAEIASAVAKLGSGGPRPYESLDDNDNATMDFDASTDNKLRVNTGEDCYAPEF